VSDYARAADYARVFHILFWNGVVTQDEINTVARANFGLPEGDDYPMEPPPADYTPPAPPSNIDVPHLSGTPAVGEVLSCTLGNWTGTPTGYAYAWQSGGAAVGNSLPTYTVADTDQGNDITCVVTASNAYGATPAPPSNAISIPPDPGATRRRSSA